MSGSSPAEQERRLAQRAVGGSLGAWHELVERYSGLIYALTCRFLTRSDEDERRTVYVDVLESLHDGALERYDGRSRLSTWIGVVTRSRCLDHLRKQHGRRQDPDWLQGLAADDRTVYRLYYVEGQSFAQLCEPRTGNRPTFSVEQLVDALDRIDAHLDRSTRRRLAFELEARSATAVSGRLLEYLAFARQQAELSTSDAHSDLTVLEHETQALLDRVKAAMQELDEEERDVIQLRYQESLPAERVAQRLGLSSARRVYTVSNRAILKLRNLLAMETGQR